MQQKKYFLCGGQGSQFYQMGEEFLLQNKVFRLWINRGKEILAPLYKNLSAELLLTCEGGIDFIDTLYQPRKNRFNPPFKNMHI